MASRANRPRGIQLVEILVAGTIFIIIAVAFLNLLPAATWATKKSDNRLAALTLARSAAEEARQRAFADLVDSVQEKRVNGTIFQVKTTFQDVPDASPEYLKEIIVELRWNESGGQEKELAFRTYLSRIKR